MAKSKSGSGSIVKSVESMLPKGISLMHVVLAVVLGMMICSFMSDSGVEGQANEGASCRGNKFGDPNNGCEKGTKCYNLKTGDEIKEGETGSCATPAHASEYRKTVAAGGGATGEACAEDSDCTTGNCVKGTCARVAYTGGGDTGGGATGTTPPTIKYNLGAGAKTNKGICVAKSDGVYSACKDKTQEECDPDTGGVIEGAVRTNCNWLKCDKDEGEWDTSVFLKGMWHDHLVKCLGNTAHTPDKETLPWDTNASKLPIYDKASQDKPIKTKNFLETVKCTWDNDSHQVSCADSMLPTGVIKKVQELGNNCAKGWNENENIKDVYKKNGGGPIMAFNKEHGLVCKNPFYDSVEVEVSEPRLILDPACPKGNCPCKSDADLKFTGKQDFTKKVQHAVEDWTISQRCNNLKYRSDKGVVGCAPTHALNFITDNFHAVLNKSTGLLNTNSGCKAPSTG